jgi:hypothetical protein
MTQTAVSLSSIITPYGSARGITESLSILDNGTLRRTVNGTLVDTTRVENRKFGYSVKCNDLTSPTLSGVWKGMFVTVESAQSFRQFVNHVQTVTLIRSPVSNTVKGFTSDGTEVSLTSVTGTTAVFASQVDYVTFNPTMDMRVTNYTINNDEYAASEAWQIDLEEV